MIELKNVSYSVGEGDAAVEIIKDISLTIDDGKLVVITGPNGSGKSTLAKLIMGIAEPTSGTVLLDGEDITKLSVTERATRGVAYAFQQPPRMKGMTVRELLSIAAGKTEETQTCDFCRFLTDVGLCANDYIDREIDNSLSGGEVKRIEIASLLARAPRVAIYDEPEAGIDLWSFSKLTETFNTVHRQSAGAIVIISHQERILELADEIIVLAGGKILQQGPKEEVLPTIFREIDVACCCQKGEIVF